MKHPNQAALALLAGGDLSGFNRWLTERHVARCERCRDEVGAFESLRETLPELAGTPEIDWDRLAAEMRANVRLGLAAGECVRPFQPAAPRHSLFTPLFTRTRAAFAVAGVVVLTATGLMLDRPKTRTAEEYAGLQTSPDGIGNQALKLMNPGAQDVMVLTGAQGSVRKSYTDPDTGYFRVNEVDGQ